MNISFKISDDIRARFPQLTVHAMRVNWLAHATAELDTSALLRDAAATAAANEALTDATVAAWRGAYAQLGVKPSKYRSSIESLLRRALKGMPLETGLRAVDLYNACSLGAFAPLGAYDVARLPSLHLELRPAMPETDRFEPLGAEPSAFPLTSSLAVYAAGMTVLCWGFNVRDCKGAALTDATEDAIFFSEAVNLTQSHQSNRALAQLRDLLRHSRADCTAIQAATMALPVLTL